VDYKRIGRLYLEIDESKVYFPATKSAPMRYSLLIAALFTSLFCFGSVPNATPVSDCPFSADVNGDDVISIADFTAFLCFFATEVGPNPDCAPSADINGDNHVGMEDLLLLLPAVAAAQ
jgi:hypothetical protein